MKGFWDIAFNEKHLMWGIEPAKSAVLAQDYFSRMSVSDVLIPGIGYGRNAKIFMEHGMSVTGVEISETAIALARSELGLQIPIHCGSVENMPDDGRRYDGIFCYGLIYLLNAEVRAKFIQDCYRKLTISGHMIFTVISKQAPMYRQGTKLGEDWYERLPGLQMFFYDSDSIKREFGPWGLVDSFQTDEPFFNGLSLPFVNVICKKD